ncbi:MAG: calcium/sodium antiporter [Clostridia bacterium]|nr:calcium/sodium antiporter [Clostridia bacterium]
MDAGKIVLNVVLLLVGFVLLVKGADFFVDGASGIAKKLKVSTFIIGVTVVALGTSAPELAVTIVDAVGGTGGLIVGNILGSNVINIFLILGLSAVICRLPVEKTTRFIDLPFLIITGALFVLLGALGDSFVWWEGLILLVLYFGFMAYNVILAKKQSKAQLEEVAATAVTFDGDNVAENSAPLTRWAKIKAGYENLKDKVWFLIILTVVGLGMVVGGAELVVNSAQDLAINALHIPAEIVALTVVAFGTSLPELVTSVSAARKGDVGIATGNIIGSNIANILLIGGVGALCKGSFGLPFSTEGLISGLVSLFASILIFSSCWGKSKSLGRVAGIIMLSCLVLYYVFIFLNLYVIHLY